MSSWLNELRSAWSDPAMRHAALVHMPIAMAMLGVLIAFIAGAARHTRAFRIAACAWFALAALTAFIASRSGSDAQGAVPSALAGPVFEAIDAHGEMGRKAWMFAAAASAFFAISLVPDRLVRILGSVLGIGAAVAGAGWMAVAAHRGGELVYVHGVGTRPLARALSAPAPEGPVARDSDLSAELDPVAAADGEPLADARMAHFDQFVLPVLAAHCQACHNAVRPKARLDLTAIAGALAGGRSGQPAVVPGRPEESLLIRVIKGEDSDIERMPPDEVLAAEEIETLERWIRDGAVWGSE